MINRVLGLLVMAIGVLFLVVALAAPGVPTADRGLICITAAVFTAIGYVLRRMS